jgi:UDP-hydrolysing UDP-N-acetyl-D-glucosamine 2-epimerase
VTIAKPLPTSTNTPMRIIASVTVGRSDYGIYLPVYRQILAEASLSLRVIVAAAHLSPAHGHTVDVIEADGIPITERVPITLEGDSPLDVTRAMARGVEQFAQAYARIKPDLLLLLGDRYEMFAAASAAVPLNIPIVHLHGGEATRGTMDELFRHAITKLSHAHLASLPQYAARIVQMGESADRVCVCGAPALDHLRTMSLPDEASLRDAWNGTVPERFLLVVHHPVTYDTQSIESQMDELLSALDRTGLPCLISRPNADPGNQRIVNRIARFCESDPQKKHRAVQNLSPRTYYSALSRAEALVGNSSSGIIEAASFRTPVVNIGSRQQGRIKPANVIDVACERAAIGAAIDRAMSDAFKQSIASLQNPYGDGHASERAVAFINSLPARDVLLRKEFVDLPVTPQARD